MGVLHGPGRSASRGALCGAQWRRLLWGEAEVGRQPQAVPGDKAQAQ